MASTPHRESGRAHMRLVGVQRGVQGLSRPAAEPGAKDKTPCPAVVAPRAKHRGAATRTSLQSFSEIFMDSEVTSSAEKTAGKLISERYLVPILERLDFWSRKKVWEIKKKQPGWRIDYLDYLLREGDFIDGGDRPESHVGELMDQPLRLRLAYLTPRLRRLSAGRGEYSQPTDEDECSLSAAVGKTVDIWSNEAALPELASQRLDAIPAMFIKGGPGSGKSTLSRWLASRYAALWMRNHAQAIGASSPTASEFSELPDWENAPFPLFVEFAGIDLDGEECSFQTVIERHVREILRASGSRESIVASQLKELLEKPLVLIFDALDQVPDMVQRERLVEWVSGECKRLKQRKTNGDSMLIFTCRSQADIPDSKTNFINTGCIAWQLEELDEGQIPQFITHWMRAWEESTRSDTPPDLERTVEKHRDSLLDKLDRIQQKNQSFNKLLRVPLLLDLVCRLSKHHVEIPDQRALVFDRLIQLSLESWQRKLQLSEAECAQLIDFCEYLAWHAVEAGATGGTTDGGNAMSFSFVTRQSQQWCQQNGSADIPANEMVKLLKGDVSFLVRETHTDFIRFTHQQFQEFLAARYLVSSMQEPLQLTSDDRWIQVASFAAEMVEEGTQADKLWFAMQRISWLESSSRPFLTSFEHFSKPGLLSKLINCFGQKLLDITVSPRDRAWSAIWFHRLRMAAGVEWNWSELRGLIENPALDDLTKAHCMMMLAECPLEDRPEIIQWLNECLTDDTQAYLNHCRALTLSMLGYGWATGQKTESKAREERQRLDGYLYVQMEGGKFQMGHADESDNPPRSEISKPCRMRRFPVTRAEYARFMGTAAFQRFLRNRGKTLNSDKWDQPRYWKDPDYIHPGAPVVGVSWFESRACAHALLAEPDEPLPSPAEQADDSCPWLPRETEWERAASWDTERERKREYPWRDWQDDSPQRRCNIGDSKLGQTSPVIAFPHGVSPNGCYEMSGNVWEWQANWYDKSESGKGLRGGAFHGLPRDARCGCRYYDGVPEIWVNYGGFRVARTDL
ncbi:hypothetical protein DJ031_03415 [bacterium endosymbiont of Escarpia laminata]|nr:MAG: hypothetical protein DJ031_03415 [bacterium endosymbiont of Escarpia laminata]